MDPVTEKRFEISFSNFFLIWFFISILCILGFNSIATVVLSNLGKFSALEIALAHILFLFWIPILLFSILLSSFHFPSIDLSYESIKHSVLEKLFYFLTSPIFIIGYLIIKFLVGVEFGNDQSHELLLYILLFFPFFIWIITTIKLKELLLHEKIKKSSNAIIPRKRINYIDYKEISMRWITLSIGIPLILLAGSIFFANSDFFLSLVLILLSWDSLALSFSIIIVKPSIRKKNSKISFFINSYDKIFGKTDIPDQVAGLILVLLIIEILFNSFFIFVNSLALAFIFIVIYLLVVLLFITALFSNRISYFERHKKPPKTSTEKFLESIQRSRDGPFI